MMAFAMMAAIRLQANQSTPKKPSQSRANAAHAHPLADPGDPSNSPTTQATTHQPSLYHCMVAMATRPPGRRSRGPSQTQITTVMLEGSVRRLGNQIRINAKLVEAEARRAEHSPDPHSMDLYFRAKGDRPQNI